MVQPRSLTSVGPGLPDRGFVLGAETGANVQLPPGQPGSAIRLQLLSL
jgi:hypothetical protein